MVRRGQLRAALGRDSGQTEGGVDKLRHLSSPAQVSLPPKNRSPGLRGVQPPRH